MNVLQHITSRNDALQRFDAAVERLKELSRTILELRSPEPGPYLLFHGLTGALVKTREIRIIVERLYNNRLELLKSDYIEHEARPQNWPPGTPYPQEFQELTRRVSEINQQMTLDFQSLLLFAGIALDDWANSVSKVYGASKRSVSFGQLAKSNGAEEWSNIWNLHSRGIVWLDAFVRLFRNKMLVHREKPWQIGTNRGTYGLDWSFWVPIAPGWHSEAEERRVRDELNEIAAMYGAPGSERIQEVIFDLLHRSAEMDYSTRRKVHKAAESFGFMTPTFQRFAHEFSDFIEAATATVIKAAQSDPARIQLGYPGAH